MSMRSYFNHYYFITDKKRKEKLWQKAVFVFDTSALLNFYKYSQSTREELFSILKQVKGRLWIPHQVAQEFHAKRLDVICHRRQDLEQKCNELKKGFNKVRHVINELKTYNWESIKRRLSRLEKDALKILYQAEEEVPDFFEDKVLHKLTLLFNENCGKPFAEEERKKLIEEGKERYKNKIPPGYLDENKEGNYKFNDYLIWAQIINFARERRVPVILVIDDKKEDWWLKVEDDLIAPRPELIKEFYDETKNYFWCYTSDRFFEELKQSLKLSIVNEEKFEEAINELKKVQEAISSTIIAKQQQEILRKLLEQLPETYKPDNTLSFAQLNLENLRLMELRKAYESFLRRILHSQQHKVDFTEPEGEGKSLQGDEESENNQGKDEPSED